MPWAGPPAGTADCTRASTSPAALIGPPPGFTAAWAMLSPTSPATTSSATGGAADTTDSHLIRPAISGTTITPTATTAGTATPTGAGAGDTTTGTAGTAGEALATSGTVTGATTLAL